MIEGSVPTRPAISEPVYLWESVFVGNAVCLKSDLSTNARTVDLCMPRPGLMYFLMLCDFLRFCSFCYLLFMCARHSRCLGFAEMLRYGKILCNSTIWFLETQWLQSPAHVSCASV